MNRSIDHAPRTLTGDYLDWHCSEIDHAIRQLLDPITRAYVPSEGPEHNFDVVNFDPDTISSGSQRDAFLLMRELMGHAVSLAGILRYDVGTRHDTCLAHDDHARNTAQRIRAALATN